MDENQKIWYVYMLECSDKSIYTGITLDIEKRIKEHNSKKGSKIVRSKLPAKLIYKEKIDSKSLALKRESEIKSWTREKKLHLIKNQNTS